LEHNEEENCISDLSDEICGEDSEDSEDYEYDEESSDSDEESEESSFDEESDTFDDNDENVNNQNTKVYHQGGDLNLKVQMQYNNVSMTPDHA
jgi:hypothetical protein